jgi:hypothetical protein
MAVIGGIMTLSSTGVWRDDDTVGEITCGSDVMRPGDVCEETRGGVGVGVGVRDDAVAEREAGAKNFAAKGRWIQLGIGSGLIILAAAGIVLTKRRRARRPPTTADLYLQQHAAWQQQQHQQQQWPAQPAHFQQPQYPPQQYPDFGPRG